MSKQILIGEEFFDKIIEGNFFYIDKTLLIKELLEERGGVTLITRPRRFGKTLNMNMLRCFFDATRDSGHLFRGLQISEHRDIMDRHLNKHPVVYMTLKDAEFRTYEGCLEKINYMISEICRQNLYLYESDRLDQRQKELFHKLFMGKATESEMQSSLKFLTECLHEYHKKKVIVLIDEYDAPINNALMEGYYQDMVRFMRGFLGGAFKSNDYLEFGLLTGVQRISKEGLVSGFNNPKVCGIMDDEFSACYGFTEDEVKLACEQYGYGDRYCDVKRWYDGYRFGDRDMYNPWSIVQFLSRGKLRNYWANTASTAILEDVFFKGSLSLKNDMAGLLTDIPIEMGYDEHIVYPIPYESDDAFWSLLLNAGYLKPCAGSEGSSFKAELVNREVKDIFADCIRRWFKRKQRAIHDTIQEFVDNLLKGDSEGVGRALNEELLNNPSCHDFKEENSYHMFIYGILLAVSKDYTVLSNRESGKGRSDCVIKPDDKGRSAVIVEFKHLKEDPADLKAEAENGLRQIEEKAYIHSLREEGYGNILLYGIAFHKKSCEVAARQVTVPSLLEN